MGRLARSNESVEDRFTYSISNDHHTTSKLHICQRFSELMLLLERSEHHSTWVENLIPSPLCIEIEVNQRSTPKNAGSAYYHASPIHVCFSAPGTPGRGAYQHALQGLCECRADVLHPAPSCHSPRSSHANDSHASPKSPKHSIALDHLKTILKFAEAGLTGIGIPGVEAIPAVLLQATEIYDLVKANKEDLKNLCDYIDKLKTAVLDPIEERRKQGEVLIPKDVSDRAEQLHKAFSDLRASLTEFQQYSKFKWTFRREEITTALKEASRTIDQIIHIFHLERLVNIELVLQDVVTIGIYHGLKYISGAGYNGSEKKDPCLDGTRIDLLHKIHQQLLLPPLAFVCLYGSPGTGKSAVAKSVAKAVDDSQRLAASFFFDRSAKGSGNVDLEMFVYTLARQFADKNLAFRASLVRQLKENPLPADSNIDDIFQRLVLDPLRSLPVPEHSFVIVLDALDECGDSKSQREVASLLCRCVQSAPSRLRITFFITARPETAITETLRLHAPSSSSIALSMDDVDGAATVLDIESFIRDWFKKLLPPPSPQDLDPDAELAVKELATLSHQLFELAALRLRQVQSECDEKGATLMKAVQVVLEEAAQPSLSTTSPLYGAYQKIVDAAYSDPVRRLGLFHYRSVVGALASRRQPLALGALCALLGISERDAKAVLRPLSSVILMADTDSIDFYHTSFIDFVLSTPTDNHSNGVIGRVEAHSALATRSFITMNTSLRRNICALPDPSISNTEISDPPSSLVQPIPDHLQYSCRYWADHLCEGRLDESDYKDLLTIWSNKKMIFWLEVLSLMGEMERAVPLLAMAEDWARRERHQAVPLWLLFLFWLISIMLGPSDLAITATLLNDCQRLVQMFYPAISQNAGAVYSSAIPFMPSSYLHTCYSRLGDGGPDLIRGRLSAWPAQILAAEHPSSVLFVAISPDGRRIASGCNDNIIRLLSATTGRVEQLLKGHTDSVNSVAFSRNGARIVSGSRDHTVRIWSAASGEQERLLEGHIDDVNSVAFSPDGVRIASGSDDRTVRIWSVESGEQKRLLEGHTNWVNSVAFSLDGARIVSGSRDSTVRIWSAASGEQEQVLEEHTGAVYSVGFSPDGARIVSGSYDKTVRIWSAASGEQERVLEGHTEWVYSVTFSPGGARIVSGSCDKTVRIWSAASREQERVLEGHIDSVRSVAFSPDGASIVSGSYDRTVRVWSAASEEQERVLEGHTDSGSVRSVAFSPDGQAIMSVDLSNDTLFWDAETGRRLDQDHSLAQLAFPEEAEWHPLEDGWLRVNGLSVWLPGYIQGNWWSARDMVVIDSNDTRGRLAFIRLPSNAGTHST